MNTKHRHVPPIGVHLTQGIANRHGRFRARARWSDPASHERRSYSATFDREGEARTFLEQLQSRTHIASDPLISLADYIAEIGDRYLRGLDPSSTAGGYRGSIKVRVLPALGHLAVRSISTAVIDRAIDRWEGDCSPSTLKNTVSALTRVLDEAVRDEIIAANTARTRARRRTPSSTADLARKIPTLGEVQASRTRAVVFTWLMETLSSSPLFSRRGCPRSPVWSSATSIGTTASSPSHDSTSPARTGYASSPPRAGRHAEYRSSSRWSPYSDALLRTAKIISPYFEGLEAESSPPERFREQPTGPTWCEDSATPVCDDTISGTPEPHGSRTPASRFTSSVTSSDTPRSRQPRATCTPTPPSSRSPRNGRTSISDGAKRGSTPLDFDSQGSGTREHVGTTRVR